MSKGRLEAFSDGVLAIIITIMVLELKVPHGADWEALRPLAPVLLSYVLSFTYIAIYWNNHHHLLQITKRVDGRVLWANMYLLFWLSLVPFGTAWMGENDFAALPVSLYGVILIMAATGYFALARTLLRLHGTDSLLAAAIGHDVKGKISFIPYATAIPLAFYLPWVAFMLYVVVALMWFIPDRRIEQRLS